ncbi:class I SAM-dependent methyltransferase [Elusimicrobiota bacterium]
MSKLYKDMKGELLKITDEQLRAQIDSMFEFEYAELARFGLEDKPSEILDFCCGNAYYLIQLARKLPRVNFTGVELNEGFCEIAQERIKDAGIGNIRIVHKSIFDYTPDRKYDAIITRASLQYLFGRIDEYLRKANECLKDRGTLILIEPDDHFFMFYPEHPIFAKLQKVFSEVVSRQGGDRYMGRRLPQKMIGAGFKDIKFVPKLINNHDTGDRSMFENLRRFPVMLSLINNENFSDEDAQLAVSTLDKMCDNSGSVIILPLVMVKGTKGAKS